MRKLPRYKVCRRLGPGVYEKCQSEKFALAEARRQAQRKGKRRRTLSDYGRQLMEKQRVRLTYGISERQFKNYIAAAIVKKERASYHLYELLESRLDNVVYRLGFAPTRRAARQMVSHGHILVDGVRVKVPSYQVRPGQAVTIREGSRGKPLFAALSERLKEYEVPPWLSYDHAQYRAELVKQPPLDATAVPFDLTSVIEFYSK